MNKLNDGYVIYLDRVSKSIEIMDRYMCSTSKDSDYELMTPEQPVSELLSNGFLHWLVI